MDINTWENIFIKCNKKVNNIYAPYLEIINKELIFLKKNWPKDLPEAIIHADLFQDNIFFREDKISGVIDFYFSCKDFIAYEIALTINAWCFDVENGFQQKNYASFMEGFNEYTKLNNEEIDALNVLLRGAALRILVTRLHDKMFHQEEALVIPKDPKEYLNILKWHQENNITK